MATPTAGQVLAKRYALLREVGAGGMGAVWEARDERLGRAVAIKVMSSELVGESQAEIRFEREAKAVANLRSPHIVALHDYGVDQGVAFMVMELLEGRSLVDRMRDGPVSLHEAAELVTQVARALSTAHKAGIVHRDLKPGNILLEQDHDREIAMVIDFGVAKILGHKRDKQLTQEGHVVGTPRYMSPEHLRSEPSDPRDDVWALAVIGYQLVAGTPPFTGKGMAAIVQEIIGERPPPPSRHLSSLPPEVDALFEKAFAPKRDDRFQTALSFSRAIREIAGTEITGDSHVSAQVETTKDRSPRRLWLLAFAFTLAGGLAAWLTLRSPPAAHTHGAPAPPASATTPLVPSATPTAEPSVAASLSPQPSATTSSAPAPTVSVRTTGNKRRPQPKTQPKPELFDTVY